MADLVVLVPGVTSTNCWLTRAYYVRLNSNCAFLLAPHNDKLCTRYMRSYARPPANCRWQTPRSPCARLKAIRPLRRWWLMPIYRSCILATGNLRLRIPVRAALAAAAAVAAWVSLIILAHHWRCLSAPKHSTETADFLFTLRTWLAHNTDLTCGRP